MLPIELPDQRRCVNVSGILPVVVLGAITFPSHLELELPSEHPTVEDLHNDVFFFAVDEQPSSLAPDKRDLNISLAPLLIPVS